MTNQLFALADTNDENFSSKLHRLPSQCRQHPLPLNERITTHVDGRMDAALYASTLQCELQRNSCGLFDSGCNLLGTPLFFDKDCLHSWYQHLSKVQATLEYICYHYWLGTCGSSRKKRYETDGAGAATSFSSALIPRMSS